MIIDLAQTALLVAVFGALASPGVALALGGFSSAKRTLTGILAFASMLAIGPLIACIIRALSWRLFVGEFYEGAPFAVDDWLEMVGFSLVGSLGIVAFVLSLRVVGWFATRRSSSFSKNDRSRVNYKQTL